MFLSLYPQHTEPVVRNGLLKCLLHGMCNALVVGHRVVHSFNKHGPGIALSKECGAHSRQRGGLTCPQGMQSWGNLRKETSSSGYCRGLELGLRKGI